MKKLLIIIIIITLPLIAFFQYSNYRRYHPPVNYDYPVSSEIDLGYHDQAVLKEYYQNAIEIGQLARTLWFNEGIDIRFPDMDDSLSLNYAAYYTQLQSRNQWIEARLITSKQKRDSGWSSYEIRLLETGYPPEIMALRKESLKFAGLSIGDVTEEVRDIQVLLNDQGYIVNIDGVFGETTFDSVKSFQRKNGLLSTGVMDFETFRLLKK